MHLARFADCPNFIAGKADRQGAISATEMSTMMGLFHSEETAARLPSGRHQERPDNDLNIR
jgi:hypothetical protein